MKIQRIKNRKELFWLCIEQCHNKTSNVTHYASSGHTKTPQKTITTSRENRQVIGEYLDAEHLLKLMENISMMRLPTTTLFGEGNQKTLDNEQHNQNHPEFEAMHKNVIRKTNGKRTAPIRISAQRV